MSEVLTRCPRLRSSDWFAGCLIIGAEVQESESEGGSNLKQVWLIRALFFRLDHSDLIDGVLEHGRFDVTKGGDLASGAIGSFLNHMTNVTLRPVPFHFVPRLRFIQTLPPIV